MDDIAKPKVKAIRTGDESLDMLAKQRLRMFILVAMPGIAATSALKSVARGRTPTLAAMAQATITGPIGVVRDAAVTAGKLASGHYGDHFGDSQGLRKASDLARGT